MDYKLLKMNGISSKNCWKTEVQKVCQGKNFACKYSIVVFVAQYIVYLMVLLAHTIYQIIWLMNNELESISAEVIMA
jgi:hypothetical protein